MNENRRPPAIDPIDLLRENYQAVEMPDELRRGLRTKGHDIVAVRRRVSSFHWAVRFAGAAAAIAVLILARHHFAPSTKLAETNPPHKSAGHVVTDARPMPHAVPEVHPAPKSRRIAATETVEGRVESHPARVVPTRHTPVSGRVAESPPSSAAPLVVILAQGPVSDGSGRSLHLGDRLAPGTPIRTGPDGRVTLVARWGSELHLAPQSEMALASGAAVLTRGRLYCRNRDKEIARIDTPAGRVRLLGTVMDAAVVRKDTVAVTVVEGRVELSNPHGQALVDAGKRSVLVAFRSPQPGRPVNTFRETAWYHGRGEVQSDYGDLAFAVPRGGDLLTEIWVKKPDGSGRHRVKSYLGIASLAGWMPGERWIGVRNGGTAGIAGFNDELLDIATGQTVPSGLPKGILSPDARRMVSFSLPGSSERGMYVFDLTTGGVTKLYSGYLRALPAWSPDSRHLIFSTGGEGAPHRLFLADALTGEVLDMHIGGGDACFSPDGRRIAFCGAFRELNNWYNGVPGTGDLFVLSLAPGARPVRISPDGQRAVHPRWSPDGRRIAYFAPQNSLCIVGADGTGAREIYRGFTPGPPSWTPSGDGVYVKAYGGDDKPTLLVAADGSGAREVLGPEDAKSQLPPDLKEQTDAACAEVKVAISEYNAACSRRFEGDLAASRRLFRSAASRFAQLVWSYPLSGLSPEDPLRHADALTWMASQTDNAMLARSCGERLHKMTECIRWFARDHRRFPRDLAELRSWALKTDTAPPQAFACPGGRGFGTRPYDYVRPEPGDLPKAGTLLASCPIHLSTRALWEQWMTDMMTDRVMDEVPIGTTREVFFTPYIFQNIGTEPLTIIYHEFTDCYEIRGQAKLLPTGRILTNETFHLEQKNEGAMAREIDAVGSLDWGTPPEGRSRRWYDHAIATAKDELRFCRAVAQYEAGQPITDWEPLIEGEPARILFSGGSPGGSFGVIHSDLRIECIDSTPIKAYLLEPSGRVRIYGRAKVLKTGQICANGMIGKDGKVLSSEE